MRIAKTVVGEMLLLLASVLIFRSVWILLDQYLGYSGLWQMLAVGIIVTVVALVIVDHEIESDIEKAKKQGARQTTIQVAKRGKARGQRT
jgi:hypothetical protein